MTEMVGFSRTLLHRKRSIFGGWVFGFLPAIKASWRKQPGSRIRAEDWSDYMLRDVGLSVTGRDQTDPRAGLDWRFR
jgi:hypothetical protein